TAAEAARRLAGTDVRALLVTDVARDGAMAGPNLDLLADVRSAFTGEILASGGVRGPEDLPEISSALEGGPGGVILGRALHEGRTTVARLALSADRAGTAEGAGR
ncbi:MAG: bifunctional 1-(5-phosphoribosyl)-5-((5-phosphoribosylamino)methylideneamino)imidazole-4-carboxamide isomerase/phosphoribosylanthranilate isomerase PriA, partial [Acidobacteria bacterium ACB2]|nr:bifunctional 1-(5-phosphoribosyl)-5-((5-phosphoribosylamino)methylideneamino)imidazole-4-carboxamide isomerase/phosphoribosylanthranilate isomerase PriA [Acidobacteria bacterium ACB2]